MIADSALFETFSWLMRLLLAQIVVLFFLCLNLVSFSIPFAGDVRPHFLLAAVFYWAVYRPTLLPPWYAFALGMLMDILSGVPLGLNAFILIAVQWVVRTQRVYLMGQSFFGLWMGFAVTCFLAASAQWTLFTVASHSVAPAGPTLASIGMSILVFPLISLTLVMVHKILPVASKPLP
jgi:rod shape-determining protein MreD